MIEFYKIKNEIAPPIPVNNYVFKDNNSWKQLKKVWNMIKVNNKNTRTRSFVFLLLTLNIIQTLF